ncbi:MAG: hypothetical protein HYV63_04950 [Candidatus Schekmanbacteria bacterium]|nr:hypothetical protein [Candidatus Schekmanbacteria bacterium]
MKIRLVEQLLVCPRSVVAAVAPEGDLLDVGDELALAPASLSEGFRTVGKSRATLVNSR